GGLPRRPHLRRGPRSSPRPARRPATDRRRSPTAGHGPRCAPRARSRPAARPDRPPWAAGWRRRRRPSGSPVQRNRRRTQVPAAAPDVRRPPRRLQCEADRAGSAHPPAPKGVADVSADPLSYGRELLRHIRLGAGTAGDAATLTHVADLPGRTAAHTDWPAWAHPELVAAWREAGVTRPLTHQVAVAEHARAGRHTVVATGTASGKSLGYQLPVLTALAEDPRPTALYLSPTKALG